MGSYLATHLFSDQLEEIWIADGAGGGLRNLGYLPMPNEKYFLEFVAWLPDGKSISFALSGTLYVVPVD